MTRSAGTAIAAAAIAGTGMTWAVRGRASNVFGPSVWQGDRTRRSMALTFDDGPSPGTFEILRLLAEYKASATFFLCGVNTLRHREAALTTARAGHEIGNHSHTHPNFAFRSAAFIETEFSTAQEAIANATACRPALVRAPYGVRWFGFRGMQRKLGLEAVMWSVIGLDWKLSGQEIAARVLAAARPGAIVCLHDGRATQPSPDIAPTIDALQRILPALVQRGYHLETVSQLLCPTPPRTP